MLLFTVMDYDVLTANDFAGEALLSLNTIPGVATIPQSLDTFHGLKQIDLVLMFQQNKRTFHPPPTIRYLDQLWVSIRVFPDQVLHLEIFFSN